MTTRSPRLLRKSLITTLGTAAVAIGSALALVACSSGATPETGGADGSGADEVAAIKVGVPPSIFAATANLGLTSGIFEEANLDVELITMQSAAEGMPQLLNGDLQFAMFEAVGAFQSASEGIPVELAAPISINATEPPADGIGFGNMLVLEESPIQEPMDFEGASIGTNSIGGAAQLAFHTRLEESGVDMSTVEWVEIPGPRQVPALRQGQVDAITVAEPHGTNALNEGGVRVAMNADDVRPGAPQFAFAATTQWLDSNEAIAKRFMEAMIEANELAMTDREALNEAMGSYMELPPEVIEQVRIPTFATEWWTPGDFDQVTELITTFDLLEGADIPPAEDIVREYE